MHGYSHFSFWIPITFAKICFFPSVVTFAKITLYWLGGTVLMSKTSRSLCLELMLVLTVWRGPGKLFIMLFLLSQRPPIDIMLVFIWLEKYFKTSSLWLAKFYLKNVSCFTLHDFRVSVDTLKLMHFPFVHIDWLLRVSLVWVLSLLNILHLFSSFSRVLCFFFFLFPFFSLVIMMFQFCWKNAYYLGIMHGSILPVPFPPPGIPPGIYNFALTWRSIPHPRARRKRQFPTPGTPHLLQIRCFVYKTLITMLISVQ